MFFVLQGGKKKPASFVPEKPEASGLIHFYKKENEWKFVTEDEYEAKKDELPAICFATRHAIANFSDKTFPDLTGLEAKLSTAADSSPEYYAKYTVSDDDTNVRDITATEKQMLEGGQVYDMCPSIFIRSVKKASNASEVIPQLKLTDFFERKENEESVGFDIVRTSLSKADYDSLEVKDEKSQAFIADLKNFTQAQDEILIQ